MEIIKIYHHTIDDKGTVSNTDNISSVIDKMIRLTAKLTECYASDIIYDIDNLKDAVENGIEYEAKLKELKEKHEQEISELNREYSNKLVFCTDKLLEIKHAEEKRSLEFFGTKHGHMSTLNGEKYTDIEQIVR